MLSSLQAHLKCVWSRSHGLSLQSNFAACGPETSPVLYYPGMLERVIEQICLKKKNTN